jgi:hypothetical protein
MAYYRIERQHTAVADVYRVGFSDPASNDEIVKEAYRLLGDIIVDDDAGGQLALINGPASLPVALVLGHALCHRYAAVGVFDPKLQAYVICVSHSADHRIGDVIPAASVE